MSTERSVRNLLTELGVGHFNATMMIQDMFISPMTSDPKSPQIIRLVTHIQDALVSMGYPIAVTGYLDQPTADALSACIGGGWEQYSWGDLVANVLSNQKAGAVYTNPPVNALPPTSVAMAGLLDAPFGLPDVPGGLITYALGGYLAYRYFTKKRAR